ELSDCLAAKSRKASERLRVNQIFLLFFIWRARPERGREGFDSQQITPKADRFLLRMCLFGVPQSIRFLNYGLALSTSFSVVSNLSRGLAGGHANQPRRRSVAGADQLRGRSFFVLLDE